MEKSILKKKSKCYYNSKNYLIYMTLNEESSVFLLILCTYLYYHPQNLTTVTHTESQNLRVRKRLANPA